MKCNSWWGNLGILVLLAGCSTSISNPSAQSPKDRSNQSALQSETASTGFGNPMVPATLIEMATVPVPGLIQPTNPQARVPDIAAGRSDPFALLSMPSMTISSVSQSMQSSPVSLPPAPTVTSTLPNTVLLPQPKPLPTVALNPLAPLARPNSMPLIPLSALPATPIAPVSPSSAADAIVITGVMQIGNQWNVIVKEPDAPGSRYVQVGDYLANGRVLVKRVVTGPGAGVIVVLQQGGQEINKPISGLNPKIAHK